MKIPDRFNDLTPGSPWQEKIDRATRMMISIALQLHPDWSRRDIRREVIKDARIALDPSKKIRTMITTVRGLDGLPEEQECIQTPGIIRMVLDNDVPNYGSPTVAESVMAIVQRVIEDELDRDKPGE